MLLMLLEVFREEPSHLVQGSEPREGLGLGVDRNGIPIQSLTYMSRL